MSLSWDLKDEQNLERKIAKTELLQNAWDYKENTEKQKTKF